MYIAALDVGTTTVRCYVLNENCLILGSSEEPVDLLNPKPGYFEIEPKVLWRKIVRVITNAVQNAKISPSDIACLGLSSQRCTFVSWNHLTNEYYHNFITWKDLRADSLVNSWNRSLTIKTIKFMSSVLHLITRNNRFMVGKVFKMMNSQVTPRLMYEMKNNSKLKAALKKKKSVRFELLDSWVLHKLRSGNGKYPHVRHVSDITSCTATGLFDPFLLDWSPYLEILFGIKKSLLPKIVNNSYNHYGYLCPAEFGPDWKYCTIKITSSVSDQTAALFGSNCCSKGDVKLTLGTGAFLDLITGNNCSPSLKGMYPLVAWQFDDPVFCLEGAVHDIGTIINWAQQCGLFRHPHVTSYIAESIMDSNGVYFVPAFSGLGTPINDNTVASGFIGITPSTRKTHLIRALLESIVFRLVQLCETAEKETSQKLNIIRVDGGVSKNNFICQLLADATGLRVERGSNTESSIMGATYIAGINFCLWNSLSDVNQFYIIERMFFPNPDNFPEIRKKMKMWLKAVDRLRKWH